MNRLSNERRIAIISALVEGNSIRATCRLTATAKGTVLKLLAEVGAVALAYQQAHLVNLPCKRIECDEIWSFVGSKRKNATKKGMGDIWTFTAIDAETKLMVSWLVGQRLGKSVELFIQDVASRLANRVQITTDGSFSYITAIEKAFGWAGADFAQLVKTYGDIPEEERKRRYSPAVCTGAIKTPIMGRPDMDLVSTSYVERANLTMRMSMRRFTRLTNAFSKKAENHAFAVSLHFMHYNFCRVHQTLTKANNGVHRTPAMAAGISDHVWKIEEIVGLLEQN